MEKSLSDNVTSFKHFHSKKNNTFRAVHDKQIHKTLQEVARSLQESYPPMWSDYKTGLPEINSYHPGLHSAAGCVSFTPLSKPYLSQKEAVYLGKTAKRTITSACRMHDLQEMCAEKR